MMRDVVIEQVAGRAAENIYPYDDDAWAAMQDVNDDTGWTIEISVGESLTDFVRHEAVRLNYDDLQAACVLGQAYWEDGGSMTVAEARRVAAARVWTS